MVKVINSDILYSVNSSHIEYDEEEYTSLINNLSGIKNKVKSGIESGISNIKGIINSFPDPYQGEGMDNIKSDVDSYLNNIDSLSNTIKLSLAIYDNCDKELKNIIDSEMIGYLFDVQHLTENNNDNNDLPYVYAYSEEEKGKASMNVRSSGINLDKHSLTLEDVCDLMKSSFLENLTSTILEGIEKNRPKNYESFNFNPTTVEITDAETSMKYDVKKEVFDAKNCILLVETIDINGTNIEFAQVLPRNYTKADLLISNYGKANVINTYKTLPNTFLKCMENDTNSIILKTTERSLGAGKDTTIGFYRPRTLYKNESIKFYDPIGTINLMVNKSLIVDVGFGHSAIHELGHKFDDSLGYNHDGGYDSYSNGYNHEIWNKLREENYKIIAYDIFKGKSYVEDVLGREDMTHEFFAEAITAYFTEGEDLKRLCPLVYEEISELLGGDYGDAYNKNIKSVLNGDI